MNRKMNDRRGFTIIELLTVIAVIAILATILIPTIGRVRESARRAQTRTQFSQWISAIETFRTEYGHWPDFRSRAPNWEAEPLTASPENNLVVRINDSTQIRQNFVEYLSGRKLNGEPLSEPRYDDHPNRRRVSFYDFTENDYEFVGGAKDLNANNVRFVDGFGNTDILLVMDGDYNGVIPLRDTQTYQVKPEEPNAAAAAPYGEPREIRAGVIMYSAGAGWSADQIEREKIVRSW